MVSSEAVPFSKSGGLADVSTSLTKALGRIGHTVTLVTPRYRGAAGGTPRGGVRAFLGGSWFDATFLETPLGENATAVLVDCPPLYDRAGLYHENTFDYPDNPTRFAFLSIAALEWASATSSLPSIVHAHDWQTGLTPVYARQYFPGSQVPLITTIHNLAFQGWFHKSWVPNLGLRWEDFTVDEGFEFYDQLCFLKAAVNFSDALTTVSPTYAKEIQTPAYGRAFDGIIRRRSDVLTGILNGIDTDVWDPANDKYLPAPFTADDLHGKTLAKRALLEEFRLPADDEAMTRPMIGIVSRFADQKGFDLLEAAARDLPTLDATLVIVGHGEPRYEQLWRVLAAEHPARIATFIGFDERIAHVVEGGADILLMPSRFEPCGLNQMYSMRYGTVPVVRAVGGLIDTVRPYNPRNGQGTGFLFREYEPPAMIAALREALATYQQQRVWRRLQVNGMRKDFSWDRSAAEYVKVYKGVMAARRNTGPRVAAS